jgi:hypothetical protein
MPGSSMSEQVPPTEPFVAAGLCLAALNEVINDLSCKNIITSQRPCSSLHTSTDNQEISRCGSDSHLKHGIRQRTRLTPHPKLKLAP